jgi:hypothetical protein
MSSVNASGSYLLDTNVLLLWLRGAKICETIDGQFHLTESGFRPLICEVTLGEIEAFAMSCKWGEPRKAKLAEIRAKLVVVDLTDDRIIRAYAELSTLAKEQSYLLSQSGSQTALTVCGSNFGDFHINIEMDSALRETGWELTIATLHGPDVDPGFPGILQCTSNG